MELNRPFLVIQIPFSFLKSPFSVWVLSSSRFRDWKNRRCGGWWGLARELAPGPSVSSQSRNIMATVTSEIKAAKLTIKEKVLTVNGVVTYSIKCAYRNTAEEQWLSSTPVDRSSMDVQSLRASLSERIAGAVIPPIASCDVTIKEYYTPEQIVTSLVRDTKETIYALPLSTSSRRAHCLSSVSPGNWYE